MHDIEYEIELKYGRDGPEFFFKIDLPVIVLTSDPVPDCNLGFLPHIGGQHGAKYWSVWFKIRLKSGIHSDIQNLLALSEALYARVRHSLRITSIVSMQIKTIYDIIRYSSIPCNTI